MKTVVITGSARGFGFEMIKLFRKSDYNVVLCDLSSQSLEDAKTKLQEISSKGEILSFVCDVTKEEDVLHLIQETIKQTKSIDIWINNAGVNQPNRSIWEVDSTSINRIIDVDLKGTILCSKCIMPIMIQQHSGQIYNIEGYGSNDAKMLGLSLYGTSKRAVTYFTEALALEAKEMKTGVCVGKITPGIMITNFISTALGNGEKIDLPEKTKKVYNILGDYPETIAAFMVKRIIKNKKNNVKFAWLTNRRAFFRFLTCGFRKRNFFES